MHNSRQFLLDTHALIFWVGRSLTTDFTSFLDRNNQQGRVFVSSISFWEIALLANKGRIAIDDVHSWTNELLILSGVLPLNPTPAEMIDSVHLPRHHKDPFDRLLIAQALAHDLTLITRDAAIQEYDVPQLWM